MIKIEQEPIFSQGTFDQNYYDLLFLLGREVREQHEEPFQYTTVAQAVRNWAADPLGVNKLNGIAKMYGIESKELPTVLIEAGMGEYLHNKAEGRFIGTTSTQLLIPDNYNISTALMLGKLHKRGIPTALMILYYPQDKFLSANPDKKRAFDEGKYIVGVRKENKDGAAVEEIQTVQIQLQPNGILHDEESEYAKRHNGERIEKITNIRQANSFRCDQILIKVSKAVDPSGKRYPEPEGSDEEKTQAYLKAALGVDIAEGPISLTDFYKTIWIATIAHLRNTGILPNESEMPMFFVSMEDLYKKISQKANLTETVSTMLGFSSAERILTDVLGISREEAYSILATEGIEKYLAKRDLQLVNGLLVHRNGMMDPSAYYLAQFAFPDLLLGCFSCVDEKFMRKLDRAQQIYASFGLPNKVVRLPHTQNEIPELEEFYIHPGFYLDIQSIRSEVELQKSLIHQNIEVLKGQAQGMSRQQTKELLAPTQAQIEQLNAQLRRSVYQGEVYEHAYEIYRVDTVRTNFVLPTIIAAMYQWMLKDVDEIIISFEVRQAIMYHRLMKQSIYNTI